MGRIAVRLQPRASRNEVYGERGGAILVRVNAPPVDGKANQALIRLVAAKLGIAKSGISLIRGESSRNKIFEIESLGTEEIRRAMLR